MAAQPKFTPGPWEVQTGGGRGDEYHDIVTTRSDSEGTARILFTIDGDKRDAEANACLTAAAPDLYAALKYAFEHAPKGFYLDGKKTPAEWIEKARAALAKANGDAA